MIKAESLTDLTGAELFSFAQFNVIGNLADGVNYGLTQIQISEVLAQHPWLNGHTLNALTRKQWYFTEN